MLVEISNIMLEGLFLTYPRNKFFTGKTYEKNFGGHTIQFTRNEITLFLKDRNGIGQALLHFGELKQSVIKFTEATLLGEKVVRLNFRVKNYHLSITWKKSARDSLQTLLIELEKRNIEFSEIFVGLESSTAGSKIDYQSVKDLASGVKKINFIFIQFLVKEPGFPKRKPSLKLIPGKIASETNFTLIVSTFSKTVQTVISVLENDEFNGVVEFIQRHNGIYGKEEKCASPNVRSPPAAAAAAASGAIRAHSSNEFPLQGKSSSSPIRSVNFFTSSSTISSLGSATTPDASNASPLNAKQSQNRHRHHHKQQQQQQQQQQQLQFQSHFNKRGHPKLLSKTAAQCHNDDENDGQPRKKPRSTATQSAGSIAKLVPRASNERGNAESVGKSFTDERNFFSRSLSDSSSSSSDSSFSPSSSSSSPQALSDNKQQQHRKQSDQLGSTYFDKSLVLSRNSRRTFENRNAEKSPLTNLSNSSSSSSSSSSYSSAPCYPSKPNECIEKIFNDPDNPFFNGSMPDILW